MDWDWEKEWVKGHQDEAIPHEDLKWEEQLNVQADKLATMARTKISNKDGQPSSMPRSTVHQ
eukprot:11698292-Ditylum_brightwellii.AAC.1